MKRTLTLIATILGLTGCSQYTKEKDNSSIKNSSNSLSYFAPYFTTREPSNQCLISSLQKTWKNDILLIGWKKNANVGYDISRLTSDEKVLLIEEGIQYLQEQTDQKEPVKTSSTILAHYYFSEKDYKKAMYWAFKGAESGSASCMYLLGRAHISGDEGVVQDFEEALKWIYLASALGDKSCKHWIDEGVHFLFKDNNFKKTVLEAQKRSSMWMKEHSDFFASLDQESKKTI